MNTARARWAALTAAVLAAVLAAVAVLTAQPSQAQSIATQGMTLSWNEQEMYEPTSCSRFTFSWYNGTGRDILTLSLDVTSRYGDVVMNEAKVGVAAGATGVFTPQICSFHIRDGGGVTGYTVRLTLKDYSMYGGGSTQVTAPLSFLSRSTPTPSPSPSSTPSSTPTSTPSSTPTPTNTTTPAPVTKAILASVRRPSRGSATAIVTGSTTGLSGKAVTIWSRPAGTTRWTRAAITTIRSDGTFSSRFIQARGTQVYAAVGTVRSKTISLPARR